MTLSDQLTKNGCSELIPLLPKYILFRVMLGMWRPRKVDDVCHPTSLCHHKGLASLLSRQEYCSIHRHYNCSSADLLEAINAHWSQLWVWGWAAAGDESIVPHKGKRAGPMRMFIPRKPLSTRIKLFVLSDSVHPFVTDIFLNFRREESAHFSGSRKCGRPSDGTGNGPQVGGPTSITNGTSV